MPFDEDETGPSIQSQKIGLKKVSGQKSVFDGMPKKQTQEQLDEKVKEAVQRNSGYKHQAAELATMFNRAMADKTLARNRNVMSNDAEREILQKMVQLAIDINNDPKEQEGMGSLSWITLLLRTCFSQRDKINDLEYDLHKLKEVTHPSYVSSVIKKEIAAALEAVDKKKVSE